MMHSNIAHTVPNNRVIDLTTRIAFVSSALVILAAAVLSFTALYDLFLQIGHGRGQRRSGIGIMAAVQPNLRRFRAAQIESKIFRPQRLTPRRPKRALQSPLKRIGDQFRLL